MPESSPTAKQLASSLYETDKTASGLDVSMGGRTFMLDRIGDLMLCLFIGDWRADESQRLAWLLLRYAERGR